MRIASLDLGSNSFLCLIADTEGPKICGVVCDEMRIVRLSEGVQKTGFLSEASLQRARQALNDFKEIIIANRADKVIAVTTAVARQAKNSKVFLDMLAGFQFPVSILSGLEEAEVTYLGATSGLSHDKDLLVIDIGGGSTEIVFNKNYAQSFDFGVVRLKERFNLQYPIDKLVTGAISKYIDAEIRGFISGLKDKKIDKVVAVAGTPTTLASMELGKYDAKDVNGFSFTLAGLEAWYFKLAQLKPDEIIKSYSIEAGRADVISLGVLILIRVLASLSLSKLEVSTRGVRYGVLLKAIGSNPK